MTDHVLLLHGLWMHGASLSLLKRRLERAQFSVELFNYASVAQSPEISIERLVQRIRASSATRVHLVAHSLGGIIALHALQQAEDLAVGHVVCLGSPLKGSAAARRLARLPGGKILLGKSAAILSAGMTAWNGQCPVGVIAGRLPIGLGFLIGGLSAPHDGTVSVAETELPGLTAHCVVPSTHTGLVFSEAVATHTIAFLKTARFSDSQ